MIRHTLIPAVALLSVVACTPTADQLLAIGAGNVVPSVAPAGTPTATPAAPASAAPSGTASALSANLTLDGKPMTFNLEVNPAPQFSGSSIAWGIGKFGSNGPDNAYVLATLYTSAKNTQAGFTAAEVTSVKLQLNPSAALAVSFIGTPNENCRIVVSGNTAEIHYKGQFNSFDGKTRTTPTGEFNATGLKLR